MIQLKSENKRGAWIMRGGAKAEDLLRRQRREQSMRAAYACAETPPASDAMGRVARGRI